MARLIERDEDGNAEIIALSDIMPEIYAGLSYSETIALAEVIDKLALLETKDEPAKVAIREVKYKKPAWRMPKTRPAPFCPACTERLMHSGAQYCEFCGQRLDWKV